ncbi:hypothetical protein AMAG_04354 [Allomyces macrogynus ATCC 38327]|uniref:Uncharacterized protein n=1 Tax=Allomyces macrogynus (strain ATCC 38327) TaxID=578462 RepID=A0A0L0S8S5_ALLM3|nr:hypothetical protein AMAG_04354 [Allomyces macrogynus ATCC 38327]|eukprot:KNE58804.1 hypothetical protein AMAG_04354 [Allomyces macrogynus ATCC 38327]
MDAPPGPAVATSDRLRGLPDLDPSHDANHHPAPHHARYVPLRAEPRWRAILASAGPLLGIPATTRDRVLRDLVACPLSQSPRLAVMFFSPGVASARAGRVSAHWLARERNEVGDYVTRDTVRAMILSPARVESGVEDEFWTRIDVNVVTVAPVARPVRGLDAGVEATMMRDVRRDVRARKAKREMRCEWEALEEVVDEMVVRAAVLEEVELAAADALPPPLPMSDVDADGMDVDVAVDDDQEPPAGAAAGQDHDTDADGSDSDHDSALTAIPPSSAFADCLERLLRAHVLDDPLANVDVMAVLADPDADPDAIPVGALGEGDSAGH